VAIRYGETVTAAALIALLRQVIASDGVGGWRELKRYVDGAGLDAGLSGIPGR
jgi:hypothetical protein